MSSLIVTVQKIEEIKEHTNADALELAIIGGWQCVIKKGSMPAGQLCVYFPIDSILPVELSDIIGVTGYLSKGKVKAVRLRGEPSYGLLWSVDAMLKAMKEHPEIIKKDDYVSIQNYTEGTDVAELFGITKWEPPMQFATGGASNEHPSFFRYTGIENMRNFMNIITEGEEVVISEKIHGSNSRFSYVDGEYIAGSHYQQKIEDYANLYWALFTDNYKDLLKELSSRGIPIIYSEIYGKQDLKYGLINGAIDIVSYDISINGLYLDYDEIKDLFNSYDIIMPPELYRGPFSMDIVKGLEGPSKVAGANNIMEGVVIKPVHERYDPKLRRVILKYLFNQYLTRKGGSEFK